MLGPDLTIDLPPVERGRYFHSYPPAFRVALIFGRGVMNVWLVMIPGAWVFFMAHDGDDGFIGENGWLT